MIAAGRVRVDGERAHVGQQVDAATASVEVDGLPLPVAPDLVHFLVYKAVGVISTASDPHGRPTVVGMFPAEPRVYPVGRLDADSEGLLVVTNDGALTELLTHPRYGVPKTYVVMVAGSVGSRGVRRLEAGIDLDDGVARAASVRVLDRRPDHALVEVVMKEGRKREVRRMFDAIGHPVRRLVRTAIGPLRDPDLRPGTYRPLTVQEVRSLYDAVETDAWEDGGAPNPTPPTS